MTFDPERTYRGTPYEGMTDEQRQKYAEVTERINSGKIGGSNDGEKSQALRHFWRTFLQNGLDISFRGRTFHIGRRSQKI